MSRQGSVLRQVQERECRGDTARSLHQVHCKALHRASLDFHMLARPALQVRASPPPTWPSRLAGTTMSDVLMGTGSESSDTLRPSRRDTAHPLGAGLDSTSMRVCGPTCCGAERGTGAGLRPLAHGSEPAELPWSFRHQHTASLQALQPSAKRGTHHLQRLAQAHLVHPAAKQDEREGRKAGRAQGLADSACG